MMTRLLKAGSLHRMNAIHVSYPTPSNQAHCSNDMKTLYFYIYSSINMSTHTIHINQPAVTKYIYREFQHVFYKYTFFSGNHTHKNINKETDVKFLPDILGKVSQTQICMRISIAILYMPIIRLADDNNDHCIDTKPSDIQRRH